MSEKLRRAAKKAGLEVPAQDLANLAAAVESHEPQRRVLHVNGKAVPVEFEHAIAYSLTDEGIADRNASKPHALPAGTAARVTASSFDKGLQRMLDDERFDSDPFSEKINVLKEKHPDKSFRMLSPRVVERRGMRIWEKHLDEKGQEIKVAGMFVGSAPKHVAEARNAHYQELGNEAMRSIEEKFAEEQDKLAYEVGSGGALRSGITVSDNLRAESQGAAVTGFHVKRGLPGEATA